MQKHAYWASRSRTAFVAHQRAPQSFTLTPALSSGYDPTASEAKNEASKLGARLRINRALSLIAANAEARLLGFSISRSKIFGWLGALAPAVCGDGARVGLGQFVKITVP